MVRSQALIPLIWLFAVLGAFAAVPAADAQPSELFACLGRNADLPNCWEVGGAITFSYPCEQVFIYYLGRIAWYPLLYVGPIEVEVEAGVSVYDQFPLYVEIVPLTGVDPSEVCDNAPGQVLMTLYPRRSQPEACNYWESSRVVDLSSILSVGSTYALRLYFFHHPAGNSPGVDCVRITSHPTSAPIERESWGGVKCLYR